MHGTLVDSAAREPCREQQYGVHRCPDAAVGALKVSLQCGCGCQGRLWVRRGGIGIAAHRELLLLALICVPERLCFGEMEFVLHGWGRTRKDSEGGAWELFTEVAFI